MRRYNKIKVFLASGEWETWNVPNFIGMDEVARHRQHSVVVLCVPSGSAVFVEGQLGRVVGPIDAIWNQDRQGFVAVALDATNIAPAHLYDYAFGRKELVA